MNRALSIWISAEEWAPGQWKPEDDVTDVIVTLADGSRWTATFCAFKHIDTLRRKMRAEGEGLSGQYFWMADLVLVADTSRATTEAVVRDLLAKGEFRTAFSAASSASDKRAI